ncbi:sensor histidine kinase [Undibacterium sp. Ji22W]|uniref:sensor histidine kinase n=1 Tax=Undibacterium sp. Ji22W TaxID=3413038 RepID=UPI003BF01B7B
MAGCKEFDLMPSLTQQRIGRLSMIGGAILFWALMVAVAIQDYWRDGGQNLWEPIFWESSSALVGSFLFYLQLPVLTDRQLLQTPRRWFLRQIAYLPLVCIGFIVLTFSLRHGVYALCGLTYKHDPWLEVFVYESIKLSIFLGLFYVVIFGVQSYVFLLEEKNNAERATKLLQVAHIQRLSQQIQPHFLFNALNAISSLMYTDVDAADRALSRLAALLRHTLDLGEETETSLERELELLHAYADLMLIRFGERVSISWQIDPQTLRCKVPTMCLQVLLENTFKHTVEKRSGLTQISVQANLLADQLQLIVEDDVGHLVTGPSSNPPGIGVHNLRQRLAVMYGERGRIQIEARLPAGVRSEIILPLQNEG